MKHRPALRLVPFTALALALPACVAELDGQGPPERVGEAAHAITVAEAADTSCSTSSVKGLSEQIAAQANCIAPGAFVKLPQIGNLTLGAAVFPYLEQPAADQFMATLTEDAGTTMTVNSMLRTVAQQYLLYRWYQQGTCGIGLAAAPGNSNHESGLAVDVQNYNTWMDALESHGFSWLGSSDPVHFDYEGPGAVDHRGTDVLAFQQLWNDNNPGDLIDEDGIYGPQTEARLQMSPADGFSIPPSCTPASAKADVHPSATMPTGQDRFEDGASAGVVDLFEGETYEVRLEVENKGGEPASSVAVGVWLEDPWISAVDYLIESDLGHKGTFEESDANTAAGNPPHGEPLDPKLTLLMNALEPGEIQRITLTLQADAYSIGLVEAPDVRFWVQDVAGLYHQDDYDGPVTNVESSQTFGERLQVLVQTDVYSRARWEWDSDRLEGWTAPSTATLATTPGEGVVVLDATGDDGAMTGPETALAAEDHASVRLRATRLGGAGPARLLFATEEAPDFTEDRVFEFDLPDDGAFHEITVDAAAHPGWTGAIVGLQLQPLGSGAGTAEIDYVRVEAVAVTGPGDPVEVIPYDGTDVDLGPCQCSTPGAPVRTPAGIFGAIAAALGALGLRRRPRGHGSARNHRD